MFIVEKFKNEEREYYFILYKDYCWDEEITKLLHMDVEEYRRLLVSFGAEPGATKQSDVKFYNENYAKDAVEYLNEKYGVMLKLEGV